MERPPKHRNTKTLAPSAPPKKPKTVHSLTSPYAPPRWPDVSPVAGEEILGLLCGLLAPLGHHRSRDVGPSKGKRHRRKAKKTIAAPEAADSSTSPDFQEIDKAPVPKIQDHLTVGFNSTNRHLEDMAQAARRKRRSSVGSEETPPEDTSRSMVAVFVPRADQPLILSAHLPLLVTMASQNRNQIRLVSLPPGADTRLSTALSIPRVGLLGLLDGAPGVESLMEVVEREIGNFEVPWLQEALSGTYLPVSIKSVEAVTNTNSSVMGK